MHDVHQTVPFGRAARFSARIAENRRASTTPGPTVAPIACNTGTLEKASTPKPITVVVLASTSDASVATSPSPFRFRRWLFAALLPIVLGLVVSTLYLRMHYAIDLVAGAAVGVVAVVLAPRVNRRVERGEQPA